MVTVLRLDGFQVVIFTDDHEPAHVHVFGDGEAKINLVDTNGEIELVWAVGLSRADIRKVLRLVSDNRLHLLERWRQIHG